MMELEEYKSLVQDWKNMSLKYKKDLDYCLKIISEVKNG